MCCLHIDRMQSITCTKHSSSCCWEEDCIDICLIHSCNLFHIKYSSWHLYMWCIWIWLCCIKCKLLNWQNNLKYKVCMHSHLYTQHSSKFLCKRCNFDLSLVLWRSSKSQPNIECKMCLMCTFRTCNRQFGLYNCTCTRLKNSPHFSIDQKPMLIWKYSKASNQSYRRMLHWLRWSLLHMRGNWIGWKEYNYGR